MTSEQPPIAQDERRTGDRVPMDGPVTVSFDQQQVVGPGQNVSEEGVFFIAEAKIKVRVHLDGTDEWRSAEVVRVQTMGDGQLGMAVRFV